MLAFNTLSLLSLFAILPLISAAPARQRRDASFDQIRDAVEAFVPTPAAPTVSTGFTSSELSVTGSQDEDEPCIQLVGQPEQQGDVQSHDWYAAPTASETPLAVADAKVLAVQDSAPSQSGHWQVYTTSAWIGECSTGGIP